MKFISLVLLLFNFVNAHVYMAQPVVRHSKYSDYYLKNNLVNYNIMAPLEQDVDHFSFPCKGFPEGPAITTVNGNEISMTFTGDSIPVHNGGHCQFGLVINDKFVVFKQLIRTCFLYTGTYSMIIPKGLEGKFVLFYTYINSIGNREYYMDCADIIIRDNPPLGNNIEVVGNELVVANLKNYFTIPEFPNKSDYDGSEKIINSNIITINIPVSGSTPSPDTTQKHTTYIISTSSLYFTTTSYLNTTTNQTDVFNISTTTHQPQVLPSTTNQTDVFNISTTTHQPQVLPSTTQQIVNNSYKLSINYFNFILIGYLTILYIT